MRGSARGTTGERLRADVARRIALAAQGFAAARPAEPADAGAVRRVAGRAGLLQIDSAGR